MTPLFDNQEYYKKMLELQEKLRKSEEERIRLEERFNLLEQESRIRHESCINKLRMRYIEFLEEQRSRDERNSKLLGALDRVDSSLAAMNAKTDRLYELRKEYEASILRAQASRRQTPSMAADSGILSQTEDRRLQKYASPSFPSVTTSLSTLRHPRRVATAASSFPKPLSYPPRPTIEFQDRFPSRPRELSSPWALPSLNRPQADALDPLRRTSRYPKESSPFQYPETLNPLKPSRLISTSLLSTPNYDDEKIGSVVEGELERYISKIKNLHDLEQSQEDQEQNTSGDLLNVTLSDDGLDHLPGEEKTKGVPEEVGKVLALAEDLASRRVSTPEASPRHSSRENLSLPEPNEEQPKPEESTARDEELDRFKRAETTEVPRIPESRASLNVAEQVVHDEVVAEELVPWSPENAQPQVEVVTRREAPEGSKSESKSGEDRPEESGDGGVALVEGDGDDVVEADVLASAGAGEPREETREGGRVQQYQGGNYEGNAAGYDYSNQGEGYQYPQDYQYNYGEGGEVGGGGYGGSAEYQQGESYPEGSNVQYPQGTYGEGGEGSYEPGDPNPQYQEGKYEPGDPSPQYQEGNYEPGDPNAQYQEGNYEPGNPNAQYQEGNYEPGDPNAQYQEGNYEPGDSNAQYQEGNYEPGDPNAQYREGNYEPGDPNAQYQEGNYPQYEQTGEQFQGEYPAQGNQEYDASGYGYSYDQEGYQGYQKASADEDRKGAEPPQQLEAATTREEGGEEASKKKKDVIKSILESETESSIEKNTENTESDFDFN